MNRVQRSEVLPLGDYESIRPHFRARVVEEKKRRHVPLGPHLYAIFENHDSALLQIQEMLRTERITREDAVQHEIDTYNELVPGADQLSVTLYVAIPDKDERERMLTELAGLERAVAVDIDGTVVRPLPGEREGARADRTTAVHYLIFQLPAEVAAKLRRREVQSAALVIDHAAYQARGELGAGTLAELAADLA
jgi:hypothetical protein